MNTAAKVYQFEKLYKLLDPAEQAAFGPWLHGILGNRQKDMLTMFQNWQSGKSWAAQIELLGLDPKRAQGRLDRLRGELVEKLELYLSYLAMQADPLLQKSILLLEVDRRKGKEIFPLMERKVKKFQEEKSNLRDASYHRAAFLRESAKQSFETKFPPRYRKNQDALLERIKCWKNWVEFELLELGFNLKNVNLEQDEADLEAFIPFGNLQEGRVTDDRALTLFYQIYGLDKNEAPAKHSDKHDQKLIEDLSSCQHMFKPDTFTNLHAFLFNYLSSRLLFGSTLERLRRLIEMYEWNERDSIWPMNRRVYKSINQIFLMALELTASENERTILKKKSDQFIEAYARQLPVEEQEDLKLLNRAHFHFVTGDFQKVLAYLQLKQKFTDPYYDIGYRIICVQAYIELEDVDELPEFIHNLKQRIRRSKQYVGRPEKALQNRLNFLNRLILLKRREQAEKLLEEIKNAQPLTGRTWLERKLTSYINKKPFA